MKKPSPEMEYYTKAKLGALMPGSEVASMEESDDGVISVVVNIPLPAQEFIVIRFIIGGGRKLPGSNSEKNR
jgi:hypothetical protein